METLAGDIVRTLLITAIVNLVGAGLTVWAAIYLARFKWTLMGELDQRFLRRPELPEDLPMTRREALQIQGENDKAHIRFDKEFDQLWSRINRDK